MLEREEKDIISYYCHLLLSGCCKEKKATTGDAAIAFFYGGVIEKKAMLPSFLCLEKKKVTTTFITLFDGFVAKKGDENYHRLFRWFCCEVGKGNNIIAFFYGDGVMKKVMAACNFLLSFFLFFFFGPFGLIH